MNHIISWVLLIIPTFCYAQSMRNFDYLDSASVEYCRGETRMVNYYLEQFIQKFPEDALIEEVMLRLGESYLEIKDFQPAKTKLVSVLNLKERDRKFDQDGALYHSNFDQMFPIYDSCFYSRCLQIVKSNYLRNKKLRSSICL